MRRDTTEILAWLQQWYWDECNGDWEHSYGIHIETMDNPGWSVKVNLIETELEEIPFALVSVQRSMRDWYSCDVVKGQFVAYGGPGNLIEMLEVFRLWVAQHRCLPNIFWAIKVGNVVAIRELVASDPAYLDVTDEYGSTPLAEAVDSEDTSIVCLLIDLGANVNGRQRPENSIPLAIDKVKPIPKRWTPLHIAVLKDVAVMDLLLRSGADPNACDDSGNTPLHWTASGETEEEIIRTLIRHGADRNIRNADGDTPAEVAHKAGYFATEQLINSF